MSTTAVASLTCAHCQTEMTVHAREGSPNSYHHCAGCGRWVASTYREEIVRTGTARVAKRAANDAQPVAFDEIKERMAKWIRALDENDPYRTLGLSPLASDEQVREKFHSLALANHPDRGGDPKQMRRILDAWDRIRRMKRAS